MSNYERIKTGLLIGLVCLSLILTWQLWTFQPNIALLEDTPKYVQNEAMSEERKLTDVIWPSQIVIHKDELFAEVPPDNHFFEQFYENFFELSLNKDEIKGIEPLSAFTRYDGVEMIFPTAIPEDVFLSLFRVDQEEISLPLTEIDRLFLYIETIDEEVHMQLFSNKDEKVVDIETKLSQKDFERTYLTMFDEYPEVVAIDNGLEDPLPGKAIYVPKDPIKAKKLSFTVSPISGEFFRQALFTDPDSVKYYRQSDNEESYTDGNRIINMRKNSLFMEYNNPVYTESRDRSSKHIVHRSFEFINGHGGWTDDYLLTDWSSTQLRDLAEYRLHINHFPVMSFEGNDQMVLRVSRSGKQTESYSRPLFYLDSQPIDAQEEIELPSGQAVIDKLKEDDLFLLTRLQDMTIGYEMKMPSRSFVTVQPSWFVRYDGRWKQIAFDDGEGGNGDGLE